MERRRTVLAVTRVDTSWSEIEAELQSASYRFVFVSNVADAQTMLDELHVDLIVVDDGDAGIAFLAQLRVSHPEVVRTAVIGERYDATALARAAVFQFVRHPLDPRQVCLMVKRGLEIHELARRHRLLSREFKLSGLKDRHFDLEQTYPQERQRFEKIVYVSEAMAAVCRQARVAAQTDLPILIHGETGTGKELLARAIHYNSARSGSPLFVQNCGGVPDALLQSELFGHKRGAFTGAVADRVGLFGAADGGTVLLDEISEVSPAFQVALLRFLQQGEIKPLGSDHTTTANVRVIAASNRSLRALSETGAFRRDLYFRLKGFEFEIPPLRERRADIAVLAEFFAAKYAEDNHRRVLGISARLIEKLSAYTWPGNIRELENELRRLVVLTPEGEYITTEHASRAIVDSEPRPRERQDVAPGRTLKEQVQELERVAVRQSLQRHRWNQSKAASELGLSRVGLANKMRRYRLLDE